MASLDRPQNLSDMRVIQASSLPGARGGRGGRIQNSVGSFKDRLKSQKSWDFGLSISTPLTELITARACAFRKPSLVNSASSTNRVRSNSWRSVPLKSPCSTGGVVHWPLCRQAG